MLPLLRVSFGGGLYYHWHVEVLRNIGGYQLLRQLGAGGTGTVYLAQDPAGNEVAFKLLHSFLGSDVSARKRLAREAATINKVRSQAVARVLDLETEGADAFIVTEFISGPTLAQDVKEAGPWSGEDLVDLAERLASALQQLHEAGVIHRDIKPGNIMVSSRGPVLIDFGIAQAAGDERLTSTGLVTGTPGYLAPWVLDGASPDAASDWWSWAAVLVHAATGRPPFGDGPIEAVLARVRTGNPDVRGLAPSVQRALRSALAPTRSPIDSAQVTELLRRGIDEGAQTQLLVPETEVLAPDETSVIPQEPVAKTLAYPVQAFQAAAGELPSYGAPGVVATPGLSQGEVPDLLAQEGQVPLPAPYRPSTAKMHPFFGFCLLCLAAAFMARLGLGAAPALAAFFVFEGVVGSQQSFYHSVRLPRGGPEGSDGPRAFGRPPLHLLRNVLGVAFAGTISLAVASACAFASLSVQVVNPADISNLVSQLQAEPEFWLFLVGATFLWWVLPGMGKVRRGGRAITDRFLTSFPVRVLLGLLALGASAFLVVPLLSTSGIWIPQ